MRARLIDIGMCVVLFGIFANMRRKGIIPWPWWTIVAILFIWVLP